MRRSLKYCGVLAILIAPLTALYVLGGAADPVIQESAKRRVPVAGNTDTLRQRYERWKAHRATDEPLFNLALKQSKYASLRSTESYGVAQLDLSSRELTIEVVTDSRDPAFDVWLVGDRLTRGESPRRLPSAVQLGRLRATEAGDTTRRTFRIPAGDGLRIDQVVLAAPGKGPENGAMLFGTPSLYQRLFSAEISIPDLTLAISTEAKSLGDLIDEAVLRGEDLFTGRNTAGKFNGNGRTCATCHRPENNYTIDPTFIATLKRDDPLFIAESNPNLNSNRNGGMHFEIPKLLRAKGLVLVNPDGFDDLTSKYVVRSVPHLLGVGLTLTPGQDSTVGFPAVHRLGWGGDGSPIGVLITNDAGDMFTWTEGSLRDFALGAVVQHFPKTLARVAGACDDPAADFCHPTYEKLLDLEAFMLSLGRPEEVSLPFWGDLEDEQAGEGLFQFRSSYTLTCAQRCHANAGANFLLEDTNQNFALGTEDFLHCTQEADLEAGQTYDGGFGTAQYGEPCDLPGACFPGDSEIECIRGGSYGNFTFNTVSVVEAADTAPYFHNNVVDTLEEAIGFYNSVEFLRDNNPVVQPDVPNCSVLPTHPSCLIEDENIEKMARFLRVWNSLDNIDSQAVPPLRRAIMVEGNPLYDPSVIPELLKLAIANLVDTLDVLAEDQLHQGADDAAEHLDYAIQIITTQFFNIERGNDPVSGSLNHALAEICTARKRMIHPDEPCPWE